MPEEIELLISKLKAKDDVLLIILNIMNANNYILDIVLNNNLHYQSGKLYIASNDFNGYVELFYNETQSLDRFFLERLNSGTVLYDRHNTFNAIKKERMI